MTGNSAAEIGAAVASARRRGTMMAAPAGWPPAGSGAAEEIQAAAAAAMGEPVAGWKIGATSREAQAIMGCDGPFFGPLFAPRVHEGGSSLPFVEGTLGVECEYAFRISTDQPAVKSDYDDQSVADLVGACHPALEIVGRRVRGDGFPSVNEAIADFALNVAFVHGPRIDGWRDADLAGTPVRGFVGEEETNAGHGSNVLGHPLKALAWLANALAVRGTGLKAGDWVSTGTCLGVVPAAAGSTVSGDYGRMGRVAVRFDG
ncbi:fumarylacetoacetate hydrolase family protein [Microbaculum marinum]|uniref:Fumarylacetoacetate hydrolase family protein n=1 Tax=Microbaculum marinum TaxID=1764581 RepID=A0AAW9RQN1_9HYPH